MSKYLGGNIETYVRLENEYSFPLTTSNYTSNNKLFHQTNQMSRDYITHMRHGTLWYSLLNMVNLTNRNNIQGTQRSSPIHIWTILWVLH